MFSPTVYVPLIFKLSFDMFKAVSLERLGVVLIFSIELSYESEVKTNSLLGLKFTTISE